MHQICRFLESLFLIDKYQKRGDTVSNFNECMKIILRWEGGYVNHPEDPGGMTNMGITKRVYESWLGRKVDENTMRNINKDHVEQIYRERYWDKLMADELPAGIDLVVFDFGVNAGISRSARYLQGMVGAGQDGLIGPKTLQALNEYTSRNSARQVIEAFSEIRRDYYRSLHHFNTFGRGWLNRTDDVEKNALEMIRV